MELDWFERAILGFVIFGVLALIYFLTELVIAVALFLATIGTLGFVAEKLIDHILEEEN